MKLKTFARRAAAAGAVLAALTLAALPALAAPKVQVSTTNAVADHADILSDETEQYVNDVSIKLSDACGAQIGVYTLDELLGSTTMEGFAYDVFNAWGLGSDDLDNGVLLLLAPNEADGGDYYIMRGDGLESQLSFSTLGSLLDEYMEPYWVNGDYDTGTQKTVQALANRLCSIYGVTLNSSYTDTSAPDRGGPNVMGFVLLVVAVLLVIWLITYLMRPRGPRPPRGGGGGSSAAKHGVTISDSKNGAVTASAAKAETGDKVILTPKADEGYELDKITAKDKDGKEVKLKAEKDGTYSFTMPKGGVTVDTTFKQAEGAANTDKPAAATKTILLQIGSTAVIVDDQAIINDVAPVIRNDRTLVPIRVITEALGGQVAWNEAAKEVTLTVNGKEIKMTIGKALEKYGVAPVIIGGRTFVPVRFVADELGAVTTWDDATKTVTIQAVK